MHHSSHLQKRQEECQVKHVDLTIKSQIPYNCAWKTDCEKAISMCRPVSLTWACALEWHQPTSEQEIWHSSELHKKGFKDATQESCHKASESCFHYSFCYSFIALPTHFQVAHEPQEKVRVEPTKAPDMSFLYSPNRLLLSQVIISNIIAPLCLSTLHDYSKELFKLTTLQMKTSDFLWDITVITHNIPTPASLTFPLKGKKCLIWQTLDSR